MVMRLLAWLHKLYWIPLAMAFRHRDLISHSIVGTVVRVCVALIPFVLWMKATHTPVTAVPGWVMYCICWISYGMMVNDTRHMVADSVHSTFHLRKKKGRKKRR